MGRHFGWFRGTVIASVVLAIALTGCGGGGGGSAGGSAGVGGGGKTTNPQTVGVSGTVTIGSAGLARSLSPGPRPKASGSTPLALATAKVRAIDYATGQEYIFSPSIFTDSTGYYYVTLPKGKDFILFFEKSVTGGGTERLSVVVPKASAGQVISADYGTSLVAESVATTAGQFRSLSAAWVDTLTLSVADYAALLSLTDNTFTPSRLGALIVGTLPGAGLDPTNSTAHFIQQTIVNLITDVLVPPPGKPAPSVTPGGGLVTLRWPAVYNATQYYIYRANSDNVSRSWWEYNATVTSTHWADSFVENGANYYYVVTAYNSGGEGAESAMVSAQPKAPVAGVPSGVTATPGDGMVTVNWSLVPGATGYAVYWSTESTVSILSGSKITCDAETTQTELFELTSGTVYYFVVTAVNAGVESAASAMVSAATEYFPPLAGIADGKAMISNLRNTAQSLTDYRRGTTTGPWLIDNAVGVLGAKIDNAVKPFFTNFRTSLQTFTTPAFRAIGQMKNHPTGAIWSWNGSALSLITANTGTNNWVVATSDGMTITLTKSTPAAGDYSPVNFTATSSTDTALDYHGSFDNIVTKSVTIEGIPRTVVSSADMAASFVDRVIGSGNTTTLNAQLQVDTNDSNDITGFRIGLGFASPVLTGSTQLVVYGLFPYVQYSDNTPLTVSAQVSQIILTNASLTVVGAGRFDGVFEIDLVPSKYTWERFDLRDAADNSEARVLIYWDERTATPQLLDVDSNSWEFGNGYRWKSSAPTEVEGTWTLTKKNGMGNTTSVWTITANGSGAGRTISGTVVSYPPWAPGSPVTRNFTTFRYLGKNAVAAVPTRAIFFGSYTNLDSSVPLDDVTGYIAAVFLNPEAADPFIVSQYEPYDVSKDNFPRVQVSFIGMIQPRNAGAITGQVFTENRFVAKDTTGLPQTGVDFIVVDGATSYTGGTETISGTATVYSRLFDADVYGDRRTEFSEASVALVNAVGVVFELDWVKTAGTTTLNGAVANTLGTTLGTLDLTGSIPILRWTNGDFESLP